MVGSVMGFKVAGVTLDEESNGMTRVAAGSRHLQKHLPPATGHYPRVKS